MKTKNICLQIPKVGSSSIYKLILDEFNIGEGHYGSYDYSSQPKLIIDDNESFVLHSHEYRDIPQNVKDDIKNGGQYYIINSFRDPIIRNISGMFFSNVVKNKTDFNLINQQLYSASVNNNINGQSYGSEMFKWYYENLFNPLVGFNVFDEEFDKEKGYSVYKNGNLNILMIKTEKLNSVYKEAFSELYGFKFSKEIQHDNTQKNPQYIDYKTNTVLDSDFVNTMYDNDYVRHFYTDEEINNFKKKWTKNE